MLFAFANDPYPHDLLPRDYKTFSHYCFQSLFRFVKLFAVDVHHRDPSFGDIYLRRKLAQKFNTSNDSLSRMSDAYLIVLTLFSVSLNPRPLTEARASIIYIPEMKKKKKKMSPRHRSETSFEEFKAPSKMNVPKVRNSRTLFARNFVKSKEVMSL